MCFYLACSCILQTAFRAIRACHDGEHAAAQKQGVLSGSLSKVAPRPAVECLQQRLPSTACPGQSWHRRIGNVPGVHEWQDAVGRGQADPQQPQMIRSLPSPSRCSTAFVEQHESEKPAWPDRASSCCAWLPAVRIASVATGGKWQRSMTVFRKIIRASPTAPAFLSGAGFQLPHHRSLTPLRRYIIAGWRVS